MVGAGGCQSAANSYRPYINQQLAINGGISPVEIDGSFLPFATEISVTATFRLQDPAALTNLRATLLVYEDNVDWCCGYGGVRIWDRTTRAIYDENVTLVNVGDEATLTHTFAHGGAWNPEECHVVGYLQQITGDKQIIQGAKLPIGDFSFEVARTVVSVPNGNGSAVFSAVLTNIGDQTDTFTLEPGAPFGDWVTDFRVCGDPTWHTAPLEVELDPDQACDVQIRVTTDAAVEIREGTFEVTSAWSTRTMASGLRVFNGSYSVLLVDEDGAWEYEVPIKTALETDGYLYDHWDAYYEHGGITPSGSTMRLYDYAIWSTGFSFSPNQVSVGGQIAMMDYLDNGGSFFLASQHFLNLQGGTTTFIQDYLGVDSWILDTAYEHLDGVAGDPIGDGLSLDMTFPYQTFKRGDSAIPGPTAETWCFSPDGSSAGLRNSMPDGQKVVFMPCAFHAIHADDPDPNNIATTLQRILDWLEPQDPADVDDAAAAIVGSRIEHARPNPFNPRTEIAFRLSPDGASGPVRVEIFDLVGCKVTTLLHGVLSPGQHSATWTGRSDAGTPVESGVYFVRLTTEEGKSSEKLVLLK